VKIKIGWGGKVLGDVRENGGRRGGEILEKQKQ
jgi:hypothetical protein